MMTDWGASTNPIARTRRPRDALPNPPQELPQAEFHTRNPVAIYKQTTFGLTLIRDMHNFSLNVRRSGSTVPCPSFQRQGNGATVDLKFHYYKHVNRRGLEPMGSGIPGHARRAAAAPPMLYCDGFELLGT